MAEASANLHEENLRPETIDRHRAIVSVMEELEAVDWYDQRAEAASDPELREILAHNRDEEKEHAAMALEWLRRRDPVLDQQLRAYLFTQGPIVRREAALTGGEAAEADGAGGAAPAGDGSLGIGSLRGEDGR
ncbi:MAG: ferritin [Rhodospirillaceae bacterium]|nr:ferritin [Rhodospirillaceae bacterium]